MLIAQSLANLLNGVSQRPFEQRHSSQAETQKNGFSHIVRGLMKRPPLVYVGKLTSTITGWATAFVFSINRDELERYHVAISNGDVLVYNALTLAAVTVIAPKGKAYLADGAGKGFRAATAGDTTVIVNRGVTTRRGTKKTAIQKGQALVYVRQADYGTTYEVILNDVPVGIKTISGNTSNQREQISTDKIASDLYTALKAETLLSDFTFTLYGSTILIVRTDARDFQLSTFDGLSDKGLKSVKGSVQAFADLPRRAPNGFIIEIAGDPESNLDNYWVTFDDKGSPEQEGVWRECPKPGTIVNFDELTMPHRLVRLGHVVQNVAHTSPTTIPAATIVDVGFGAGVVVPWAFTTPDNTAIPAGTHPVIRDHSTGAKFTVSGAKQRLTFYYNMDTSLMAVGTTATVTLYKNGSPIASQDHIGGYGLRYGPNVQIIDPVLIARPQKGSGFFDLTQAFANSDVIEVRLTYSTGATPDQYRRAYLTPGDVTTYATGYREIRFNETDLYPVGSTVNITIDGNVFTYNVTTTPKTGTQVATALQPTIDANGALIAVIGSLAWSIKVSNTGNTYPAITTNSVTLDETKVFYNPTLTMVTDEHAGRTIRNLSDNSTGVVANNTAQTVTTVSALTGGISNKFNPGDIISIDGTGTYFVFEPCPWNERGSGDIDVVPFPSFVDATISDAVFYQNRLGFTSGENVVFSSAGDVFNLFRYTATQLLAEDVIDVKAAHREVALFHSLALWNEGLYAISDNGEFLISGDPVLTPTTIRIDLASRVPNTPGPRPVVNGNVMYLMRGKLGFTQVSEFFVTGTTGETVDSVNITEDIPKYIKGKPIIAVGDDTLGLLAVVTDEAGQKSLYVYSTRFSDDNDRNRIQSSWSKWEFSTGSIVGLDMVDGKLGVVTVRADGVYLETIDLNVTLDSPTSDEGLLYLDRRVDQTTTGVSSAYSAGPDTTTWTIPFNVATNGTEGTLVLVNRGTGLVLTTTRPAANQIRTTGQGNLTGASVFIGVLNEFRYKPSRIYFRPKDEVPETKGRLTLRFIDVLYHDTTDFDVVVTLVGRNPITYSFKVAALGLPTSGKLTVPILSKNENATIELVNNSPGVCAFSSLDWEGDFSMRDRRI
jgi:hypothetical protein